MKFYSLFSIFFLLFIKSGKTTKWFIDNPGFNDPAAWEDEYIPCAREDVIFPKEYKALLPLPAKVDVGGFVLPRDGAIILPQEATITLGGSSQERDCDNGKGFLKEPLVRKWFDPKTWVSSKEVKSNKAIPDMERVPCNNESVVIQPKGPVAFDLENIPYLRMGQLSFWGSLLSKDYLRLMLYDDLGEYLFRNQAGVRVEYFHHDVCGCHKDFNNFAEPICHNILDTCERPHCLSPVVPYGSCCAICGTVLKFQVEDCGNERVHILQGLIKKSLEDKDLNEDLDYYVNYVNSQNYGNYLQAIVVDRDGYAEKSVNFAKQLNATTDWRKKLKMDANHILGFEYSGGPYNPNVSFGSIILIFLCIFFVSLVALIMFAHYKPDNQHLRRLPRWMYDPRLWRIRLNRQNGVFARFDNTRASVMTTTAGQAPGYTMGFNTESGNVRERQAFDNPMFGEKLSMPSTSRGGKQSAEGKGPTQKEELTKKEEVPKLVMESLDLIDTGNDRASLDEEQELTEIKLESSDDEDTEGDEEEV